MADLELVYLKMRALGEAPQMLMHHAGATYRYSMAWDHYGMPWADAKVKPTFRQLPMLVVDGQTQITQSGAIMRYLAKRFEMLPDTALDQARIDALFEGTQEMFFPLNPTVNFAVGEDFTAKQAALGKSLAPRLADFERVFAASKGPFLSGSTPYYCDFGLFHHVDLAHFIDAEILADCPGLTRFMDAMRNLSGMANYLANRPELVDVGVAPKLVMNGTPRPTGMMDN